MAIGISPLVDFAFKLMLGNVYHASPAERWAYFLQHADELTSAEISRLLPDKEISEAAGVLEMISQTPEQRMLYNGRQEGEVRGLLIGRITVLQELPGLRPFNADEFSGYDAAQLNSLAEQLQQQLRDRSS